MSYETGTATSPNDLLQKLVTFLAAHGWTQDTSTSDSSAWKACLHKGGTYANFRTSVNEYGTTIWGGGTAQGSSYPTYGINLYLGTANGAGSSPWYNGAGAPVGNGQSYKVGASTRLPSGAIVAYHFFIDSAEDNFIAVIETTPGIYVNFGFGKSITKAGSFTGGEYFFGCFSGYESNSANPNYGVTGSQKAPGTYYADFTTWGANCFIKADVDTFTSKWLSNTTTNTATYGYTGKNFDVSIWGYSAGSANIPRMDTIKDRSHNALNGAPILLPIMCFAARDAGGFSLIGELPNIFHTNAVGNGNNAGDEITIGADTYKLYPNFAVKKVA